MKRVEQKSAREKRGTWEKWNMKIMMNYFCKMVDQQRMLSLISSQDHCQRFSPSQISNTLQAGYKPVRNLSSDFVE